MDREKLREEITLWNRCINNEKGAWDDFYERYHKLIWKPIHQKIPDHHVKFDKEDIFIEAFIRIKRKLYQWKRRARLTTYVGCITRSAIIDYMRKHRKVITLGNRNVISIYGDEEDENGEKRIDPDDPRADPKFIEGKIYVDEILSSRNFSSQEVLLIKLRFLEERSPKEVADRFGVSLAVVYTRESRVRSKLKKLILAGDSL